jgi:anaerobic ribonucleoside-triphosphate reductase activating protein
LSFKKITGVTFLGGEPLNQDIKSLISLCKKIKEHNLDIVLLTGYYKNQLTFNQNQVIKYCSVVKYGPYIDSQRNVNLFLRGSENQYIECYDKALTDYYNKEHKDVEIIIDDKEVKILGYPDDFIS